VWKLCDDRDGSVIAEGTQEYVKAQWFNAADPEQGGMWEGHLYIEKPNGDQIAWNPHTRKWDAL
jgi:hypothetical protein